MWSWLSKLGALCKSRMIEQMNPKTYGHLVVGGMVDSFEKADGLRTD
ncbi:MAG: hypothetical protein H6727_21070 [Myxococcales bacterium]|nr:hypothetical protein [Myxococcales bacterium]